MTTQTQIEALKLALRAIREILSEPDRTLEQRPERREMLRDVVIGLQEAVAQPEQLEGLQLIHKADIDLVKKRATEAQPEQEPVGFVVDLYNGANTPSLPQTATVVWLNDNPKIGQVLYTTPPQRKQLTLEQLREHWQVAKALDMTHAEIDFADYVLIARDVEALYGIKE